MNTENLIKITVPLFLLAGMNQKDGNFSAKVLSHEGSELQLEVGGTSVTTKVTNQKKHYKTNTVLIFSGEGELIGIESTGDAFKEAKKAAVATTTQSRGTGSRDYRDNKLF